MSAAKGFNFDIDLLSFSAQINVHISLIPVAFFCNIRALIISPFACVNAIRDLYGNL